jgi:GDP-mannose 6-dehydrogenase
MNYPVVSVFGLGYVGSVTAACLADRGCSIIGCDVAEDKVNQINAGEAPISEPGLDDLLKTQKAAGRLRATANAAEAVRESDISIVCVGTPSAPSGALDLQFIEAVSREIADAIAEKEGSHVVIFRSTMLPGSTRRIAEVFFATMRDRVEIFFYPEFLRQGSALADFRIPSLSAIGVLDSGQTADSIQAVLEADTEVMMVESAELLKYACNAFHATKVAFANEIGRIGKGLGIDSTQVMKTLCQDTRLNISSYYMRPGTPFGGSCLPKDVSALTHHARGLRISVPVLDSLMESNRRHIESVLERIEAAGFRKVILLGLAFKEGTDDLRGSAMLEVAAALLLRGYEVRIYDPAVAPRNLIGANKSFAAAKLPSFDSLLLPDLSLAFSDGDVRTVVASKVCLSLAELASIFEGPNAHHVIDINGWDALAAIAPSYEGLCW